MRRWALAVISALCTLLVFSKAAVVELARYDAIDNTTTSGYEATARFLNERAEVNRIDAFAAVQDEEVYGYYIKAVIDLDTYTLQFDTSSPNSWVFSEKVQAPGLGSVRKYPWKAIYNCAKYSEYRYEDGTIVTGIEKSRPVLVGGDVVQNFPFLIVKKLIDQSGISGTLKTSGLIGANMNAEPLSKDNIFSVNFNPSAGSYVEAGKIVVDENKAITLNVVPNNAGRWYLASDMLGYMDIDTGTSGVLLPKSVIQKYLGSAAQAPAKEGEGWQIKCSTDLPVLRFDLRSSGSPEPGPEFKIPGTRLKREPAKGGDVWCETWLLEQKGTAGILGIPFIEQYITTYNKLDRKISFEAKS